MNIGPLEIIIVIVVLLLLFGARRLPDLGKNIGGGIRGFGKAVTGEEDESRSEEPRQVEAAKPVETPKPADATQPAEPAGRPPGASRG